MLEQSVLIEKAGQLCKIIINRPKFLNALDIETLKLLDKSLDELINEDIKVLIITGSGSKAFVAGADIKAMVNMNAIQAREYSILGQRVLSKIENLPFAVIAAVNGYALGGGCELAMACDIRVCSDNASFSLPELGLGVIPGFGGTQRMPRLLGVGVAKELLYTSRMISSEEALRYGLVNYIVTQEKLMDKCNELVCSIMSNSSFAVKMCKSSVNDGIEMNLSNALQNETNLFALCFDEENQKERMKVFLDRRKTK